MAVDPWRCRTILTLRRDCYRAAGDPLLPVAQRDLEAYVSREAQSFDVTRDVPMAR